MIKATIKFSNSTSLDGIYEIFIKGLMKISEYDSVIDRKDNDDIWIEKEIWEDRVYTVTSIFTEKEIEWLKKNFEVEILEG